jgi:serine/threonine-protein kinase
MGAPPRLIDLSVALTTEAAGDLTGAVGTDAYMAPEQCLPCELGPPGPPADVWGLGATLLKAASGAPAFARGDGVDGGAPPELRWPQLRERALAPSDLEPTLAETIEACLDPDPAVRPTPAAIRSNLEPLLEALPRPRLSRLKPRL